MRARGGALRVRYVLGGLGMYVAGGCRARGVLSAVVQIAIDAGIGLVGEIRLMRSGSGARRASICLTGAGDAAANLGPSCSSCAGVLVGFTEGGRIVGRLSTAHGDISIGRFDMLMMMLGSIHSPLSVFILYKEARERVEAFDIIDQRVTSGRTYHGSDAASLPGHSWACSLQ